MFKSYKIGLLLLVFFFNPVFSQKKTNLSIFIDSMIVKSNLSIEQSNGVSETLIPNSFSKNMMNIRTPIFSELTPIKITYRQTDGIEVSRVFFVGEQKAIIDIRFWDRAKSKIDFTCKGAEMVTDTILNSRYREIFDYRYQVGRKISDLYLKSAGNISSSDSLKRLQELYFKELNSITLDFIVKYPSEYFSLWYFGYQVVLPSVSIMKHDTNYLKKLTDYFKTTFLSNRQNSYEGRKILQLLETTIRPLSINVAAPVFNKIDISGKPISLRQFRGKIVLLDFWASWCSPCMASIPLLIELYKKYKDSGFVLLGINIDNELSVLKNTIVKHKMNWVQFHDKDSDISNMFGVFKIPSFILLNTKGDIIFRGTGLDDKKELEQILNDTLHLVR